MGVAVSVRCPSEEPLRELVESFAAALELCLCDPWVPVKQALGLCTPNLERLLGGQCEGAPWRHRKDDVYHHCTKGKAISETKSVIYTVAVLDALRVFVHVDEQFYEKLDVPLEVNTRDDEAMVGDDTLLSSFDLDSHIRQCVVAAFHVWDEFLMGLKDLHNVGLVTLSISADRLTSRDLRLSLATFVQSLAVHRSKMAKAAARSRSTARSIPDDLVEGTAEHSERKIVGIEPGDTFPIEDDMARPTHKFGNTHREHALEIFFPSFGSHLPRVPTTLQEQNVYPLATATATGFDLDYSSLLIVDRIVIDKFAYDFVSDPRRTHLETMRGTIKQLMDEGMLRTEDYGEIANRSTQEINRRVDYLVECPEAWRPTAREHWNIYSAQLPELITRYADRADPMVERVHFGVYCHLMNTHGRIDSKEVDALHGLIMSRRKRISSGELQLMREILKPILSHIIFMHIIRRELGAPFIDWDDLGVYYSRIDNIVLDATDVDSGIPATRKMADQCREMFRVALPELRPDSLAKTLKFIRNRPAVASLKAELRAAIDNNQPLDAKWASNVRDMANIEQLVRQSGHREISLLGPNVRKPCRFDWYYTLLRVKCGL
ncbi:hypothetical protein ACMHYB_09815 [Sorangium sp. So ce1128]